MAIFNFQVTTKQQGRRLPAAQTLRRLRHRKSVGHHGHFRRNRISSGNVGQDHPARVREMAMLLLRPDVDVRLPLLPDRPGPGFEPRLLRHDRQQPSRDLEPDKGPI